MKPTKSYRNNPELRNIFAGVRRLMAPYERRLLKTRDDARRYELWSGKPVEIGGRKKDSVLFASVVIQKNYVGFYFMPVYAAPEIKTSFPTELLLLLKGKSCFHLKKLDSALRDQIRYALRKGYDLYVRRGWL